MRGDRVWAAVGLVVSGAGAFVAWAGAGERIVGATWAFFGFAVLWAAWGVVLLERGFGQVVFFAGHGVAGLTAVNVARLALPDAAAFAAAALFAAGVAAAGVAALRWAETHDPDFGDGAFGLRGAYAAAAVGGVALGGVEAWRGRADMATAAALVALGFAVVLLGGFPRRPAARVRGAAARRRG